MAVRLSALPDNLPPEAHIHKMYFTIPGTLIDKMQVFSLLRKFTGLDNPVVHREFGQRYQYREWYTLRNDHNEVLIAVYTSGAGRFKNTTSISVNGLCFESWSSHNPMQLDPVEIIRFVFEQQGHFTRIDLAKNDFRRVVDWSELVEISSKERYRDRIITRLSRTKPPYYCRQFAESIYFGSDKSRTQVLAYVKHDAELTKFPWIRVEIKTRGRSQADHVARMLLEGIGMDQLVSGVLAHLVDFKEAGINVKQHRPSCRWWTQLVGTEKIKLNPPKPKEDTPEEFEF